MLPISFRTSLKTLTTVGVSLVLSGGLAFAGTAERVVMQSPAKDSAVLAKMPGLVNNMKAKTLSGEARTINDGVVIRQSKIKDGKIVIPPSGLYITVRSSNWLPFDAEPLTLAGKTYYEITDLYTRDVLRNLTMKKGQVVPSNADKTRGWQLTSVETDTYGTPGGASAEFKIVKTTGNYYGSAFPVYAGSLISNTGGDKAMPEGSSAPEGHTVPTSENGLSEVIMASNVFSVGRSHVIVDSIEDDSVKVRELATDSCTAIFLSPNAPEVKALAKGESFKSGNAQVEVLDVTADSATIKITDAAGSVTKSLGPLTPENTKWMLMSTTARDKFWTLSKDGNVAVNLNIKAKNPIADGKVELVAYSDVVEINNGSAWAEDPRFLARPET